MTTTRWWWVRHAPVHNPNKLLYGAMDMPADCDDPAPFHAAATLLPVGAICVVTPLRRTGQTAAALVRAGARFSETLTRPALQEQSFGDWEGESWTALEKRFPAGLRGFWQDFAHRAPPGGESFAMLAARVGADILELTQAHPGRDIVAVAHAGTIRAALALALNLPPEGALGFSIDNCGLTRLDHITASGRGLWRTVFVNRQPGDGAANSGAATQPPDIREVTKSTKEKIR